MQKQAPDGSPLMKIARTGYPQPRLVVFGHLGGFHHLRIHAVECVNALLLFDAEAAA